MNTVIYTIGHSNHAQQAFVKLLQAHAITAVADVRSRPYSGYNPQFDKEALQSALLRASVKYVFLGRELGARSDDPSCYERGVVQFERVAQTPEFRNGLERITSGAQHYRIAMMCAEKEPLDCHRTILVSRQLRKLGVEIRHIHADGQLETHEEALSRLARNLRIREEEQHLFRSQNDLIEDVYALQEARIAYEIESRADLSAA